MTLLLAWLLLTLPIPLLIATYHRRHNRRTRLATRADKQHAALKTNPMYAIHGDYPPKCCSTRVCACDRRRKLDADFWYADPELWPGPERRAAKLRLLSGDVYGTSRITTLGVWTDGTTLHPKATT